MLILNLGCGTRTSTHPDVVNVDWSLNIRIKNSRLMRLAVSPLLDARRRTRLPVQNACWLTTCPEEFVRILGSVDGGYHSHVLEHLDRPVAREFLKETLRVLRPGGICRIVVPDLNLCAAPMCSTSMHAGVNRSRRPTTKTSWKTCSSNPSGAKPQPPADAKDWLGWWKKSCWVMRVAVEKRTNGCMTAFHCLTF